MIERMEIAATTRNQTTTIGQRSSGREIPTIGPANAAMAPIIR